MTNPWWTEADEAAYREASAANPEAYAALEEQARQLGKQWAEWTLAGGQIAALLFGKDGILAEDGGQAEEPGK